jgi:hypothetical protein
MRAVVRFVTLPLLSLLLALAAGAACADQPRIWFENQRDERVTVSVGGDRLMILAPHSGQFLPYSTAAWAWPRRIDVALLSGAPLWSARMDADDLARQRWIIVIRPD